jgi:hypothetical protein
LFRIIIMTCLCMWLRWKTNPWGHWYCFDVLTNFDQYSIILIFYPVSVNWIFFVLYTVWKNSEIHTMEFSIALLNPWYIHTISILYPYYFHTISILYPYYIHTISILYPYYFHTISILWKLQFWISILFSTI